MVRNDVPVSSQRVHTREFSIDARKRLGLAVTRAREASGHPYRPSFARVVGLSVRSIVKLESGAPVGAAVYEAVGRALPGWTEDTPRTVLDGGDPPTVEAELLARPNKGESPHPQLTLDDPAYWGLLWNSVPEQVFLKMWREYLTMTDGNPPNVVRPAETLDEVRRFNAS